MKSIPQPTEDSYPTKEYSIPPPHSNYYSHKEIIIIHPSNKFLPLNNHPKIIFGYIPLPQNDYMHVPSIIMYDTNIAPYARANIDTVDMFLWIIIVCDNLAVWYRIAMRIIV